MAPGRWLIKGSTTDGWEVIGNIDATRSRGGCVTVGGWRRDAQHKGGCGIDRSRLVTFSMTLPMVSSDPDTRAQADQRILDGLRAVRGVLRAAAMSGLPPNRAPDAVATPIENFTADDGSAGAMIDYYQLVMGDYFGTMAFPIVAGRGFEPSDNTFHNKAAIVKRDVGKPALKKSESHRPAFASAERFVRRCR